MGVKVFVLGLPGSGKTAVARCISSVARDQKYTVKSFNDYDILRSWFETAPDGPQFSRAENDGFDVHDYTILDTSLQELEKQVFCASSSSDKEIITIEFARNDYFHALEQFSASFLKDVYILYIDAEIPICKRRTRQRFINATSRDDHYVSDYIFEAYYNRGREYCMASDVNALYDRSGKRYNIDARKLAVVENLEATSIEAFYTEIKRITLLIISRQDIAPIISTYSGEQRVFVPDVNNVR